MIIATNQVVVWTFESFHFFKHCSYILQFLNNMSYLKVRQMTGLALPGNCLHYGFLF